MLTRIRCVVTHRVPSRETPVPAGETRIGAAFPYIAMVHPHNNNDADTKGDTTGDTREDTLQVSILVLPTELMFHILEFVSYNDLVSVSGTCSDLNIFGDDDRLWRTRVISQITSSKISALCLSNVLKNGENQPRGWWRKFFLHKHKVQWRAVVHTVAGHFQSKGCINGPANTASFNGPVGVAIDKLGRAFIADSSNKCIRMLEGVGNVANQMMMAKTMDGDKKDAAIEARVSTVPLGAINRPQDVTLYRGDGTLYIPDGESTCIIQACPNPLPDKSWEVTRRSINFQGHVGVGVDPTTGDCIVGGFASNVVWRVPHDGGAHELVSGKLSHPGSADGYAEAARWSCPWGVDVHQDGSIFVCDRNNHTIRKISPAAQGNGAVMVTTLAGKAGVTGLKDGQGAEALFRYPTAIVVQPNGSCIVADQLNHCIRKVTSDGEVTLVAGCMVPKWEGMSSGDECIDGVGSLARFSAPSGLALDHYGNCYVADRANNCIRVIEF
eukprot:TRINITY_DN4587_c0_g1_i2.p1 TRINITY_DN4587_c0_g1~~TRINITY_DN4587_c0_g1_i2.p1  ORF type:complete len:497 (+),score=84.14 TRINITY_DN4587_c0_g1_i2:685-2175(+)